MINIFALILDIILNINLFEFKDNDKEENLKYNDDSNNRLFTKNLCRNGLGGH